MRPNVKDMIDAAKLIAQTLLLVFIFAVLLWLVAWVDPGSFYRATPPGAPGISGGFIVLMISAASINYVLADRIRSIVPFLGSALYVALPISEQAFVDSRSFLRTPELWPVYQPVLITAICVVIVLVSPAALRKWRKSCKAKDSSNANRVAGGLSPPAPT